MEPVNKSPRLLQRILWRAEHWLKTERADSLRSQFATCGQDVSIQWPVVINGADHLRVGSKVSINAFVHIWAQGGVSIGDLTLIGSHVSITSLTHAKDSKNYGDSLISKPVEIGRNVWVGTHAVILPGVTIGDGAIIGAGAVVTRDVAAGDTVVGVPAESLRTRKA
jgi:maltose O-acetyltransferase